MSFFADRGKIIERGILAAFACAVTGCGGPSDSNPIELDLRGDSVIPAAVLNSEVAKLTSEKGKSVGESSYTLSHASSDSWTEKEVEVNALVSKIAIIGQDDNPDISVPAKMAKINRMVDDVDLAELSLLEKRILQTRIITARTVAADNFFDSLTASGQIGHPSQFAREQVRLKAWASR